MASEAAVPNYSLDEALSSIRFGKFQYLVLAYAGMGWISDAMEMMLLSFLGPAIHSLWSLSSKQESFITTIVFIGMLVGAYMWGIVSDTLGRRKGFLFTAIVTAAAGFLSAIAPNYAALLVFRCLVGFGLGGAPVLLSWFVEFVPAPRRGAWLAIIQAFWAVGATIEAAFAWIIMSRLGWRYLLAFSALPSLLLVIFYVITPESPRYLCSKGRKKEALEILEKMAKVNGTRLPSGVLTTDHHEVESEHQLEISVPADGVKLSSTNPGESMPPSPKVKVNVKDSLVGAFKSLAMLLSRQFVRRTLLIWVLFIGNAFSYYGTVLLTTELNNKSRSCGPTKVNSHDNKPENVNYKNVFITSFGEFPGVVLAGLIVDRLGRKLPMGSMFFVYCVFLIPLAFHQSEGVTTALLFGARASITTTFTIVYIYAPEVYPTSLRSTAVGSGCSMGRIGGMVCPLVAVGLVQGCHQMAALILFIGVAFISGICVFLLPFETKGLALVDSISNDQFDKPNGAKSENMEPKSK